MAWLCVLGSFYLMELHATERGDIPTSTAVFPPILKLGQVSTSK